jgi:hypothetical protein
VLASSQALISEPGVRGSGKKILILHSRDHGSDENPTVRKTVLDVFRKHRKCELLYECIEGTGNHAWDSVVTVKIFGDRGKRNADLILSIGSEAPDSFWNTNMSFGRHHRLFSRWSPPMSFRPSYRRR